MNKLIKIDFKDIVIVFVIPSLLSILLIVFKFEQYRYIYSFLVLYFPSSLYLAYKNPAAILGALKLGLFAFAANYIFEFMAINGNAWLNRPGAVILWGGVGLELMACAFIFAFNIALFCENYLVLKEVRADTKKVLLTFVPFILAIVAIYFIVPGLYLWTYYVIAVGFGFVPIGYVLLHKPHPLLLPSMLIASLFYSGTLLLLDLINLSQGWMIFRGTYLFTINIFGLGIPVEEMVVFILLTPFASVFYYLYIFKSRKNSHSV